jgi:hypothetical protein
MKKAMFFWMFFIITVQAYSIETSSLPPRGKRVTLNADLGYTIRELKKSGGGENDYNSIQMIFTGGFNPFDHLSVFAKAGASDMQFRGSDRTPLSFTLGGGLTVSLLDPAERNNVLIDAQMDYFTPKEFRVIDYQFGATYIYRNNNVIPYAGIKFSDTSVKNTENNDEWEGKWKFGIVIGIQYFVNPNVFFSAEMHNFDQDSIYGGVGFVL